MKKLYKILFSLILFSTIIQGCEYDLDINTDPNNPQEASCDLRLPYILEISIDTYGSHGTRTAYLLQQLGFVYTPGARGYDLQNWKFQSMTESYVWQTWYIHAWINIKKMIIEAESVEAWNYVGIGQIIQACGCGFIVDAYGVMAYKDGLSEETVLPTYNDAEYVYEKVLALCDQAIVNMQRTPGVKAPSLSNADFIYKGDMKKWLKFAYGVKARLLSHLSKKKQGTGLKQYNPDEILNLLSKSFQSNDDDMEMQYVKGSTILLQQSINFQNISWSTKFGKLYISYLLNNVPGSGKSWNSGIEDPRAEKILPRITAEGPLKGQYTLGIDLEHTDYAPSAQDSTYVGLKIPDKTSPNFFIGTSCYTQDNTPYGLLSFCELKFIEAEVYFRKGDMVKSLAAYKAAVGANIDKLKVAADKRDVFLASAAIAQSPEELTLSHIMMQKYVALTFNPEVWTDMRRCDFCLDEAGNYNEEKGVYKGFIRPKFAFNLNFGTNGYPRRYQMAYYEKDYNANNVRPWGVFDLDYMTKPVWWDIKE